MKKFGWPFPAKHGDQTCALFSVLCIYAMQKTLDVTLKADMAKWGVGIPTKVSQELLEMEEAIFPQGNRDVVFRRLIPCCTGSVLTAKVILNK